MAANWPKPNFDNPESRGPALVIVVSILLFLVSFAISTRIYSKVLFRRGIGADDWLAVFAALFFFTQAALSVTGYVRFTWGMHMWDAHVEQQQDSLLSSWIAEFAMTLCLVFSKLSICCTFLRIFTVPDPANRRIVFALMFITVVWGILIIVSTAIRCKPVQAVWIRTYSADNCGDTVAGAITHIGFDIFIDLCIYILPLKKVWGIQSTTRQRLLALLLYAFGTIVCAAAVIRLPLAIQYYDSDDTTWHMWESWVWGNVESGLGVVVICMPAMLPLLVRLCPSLAPEGDGEATKHRHRGGRTGTSGGSKFKAYPLGNISTTVSGKGPTDWWSKGHHGLGGGESEENIVMTDKDAATTTTMGTSNNIMEGITKTTVIEQTICDEDGRSVDGVKAALAPTRHSSSTRRP